MEIAIVGYGRMGKAVEQVAKEHGHTVAARIDSSNQEAVASLSCDAAIEFTTARAAVQHLKTLIDKGIPVATGTTGWDDKYEEVAKYCRSHNGTMLQASNFSLGVNIFFAVNRYLGQIMGAQTQYNASIEETHHVHKRDAPSGTAISLAKDIIARSGYSQWVKEEAKNSDELPVVSHRIDEVPGIHQVEWDSAVDTVTITHQAKSRQGFALGAVLAAEFLSGKQGVFTMNDLLEISE